MGQVLGEVGALPDVYTELEVNFFLLRRLLGVRTQVRWKVAFLPRFLASLQKMLLDVALSFSLCVGVQSLLFAAEAAETT